MNSTTLDLFEEQENNQQLKYALCEEFADEYELPVDYVWEEFVNPDYCSLAEVEAVLNEFPTPAQ